MDAVENLEQRFLPLCKAAQHEYTLRYPQHDFRVWSGSVGGNTDYKGHNLGLEVLFSNAGPMQADNLALSVGIMHITTSPKLSEACVTWGVGSSPEIDTELISEPIPLTENNLARIEAGFPKLLQVFDRAIAAFQGERGNAR